jgi:uridine kinase
MVVQFVELKLVEKSRHHRAALTSLEAASTGEALSDRVEILPETPQLQGIATIIQDIDTNPEDLIFYLDRLAVMLIERSVPFRLASSPTVCRAWPAES